MNFPSGSDAPAPGGGARWPAAGLPWWTWRHITKVDPDRPLSPDQAGAVRESGTDLIVIGGTLGIERAKVVRLLDQFAGRGTPVAIEMSSLEAAVPGADLYLMPVVLNASDPAWICGAHQAAIQALGDLIPWDRVLPEGYIIMNRDSAAARVTGARVPESTEAARAWALTTARVFGLPLVYLEYSGRYGDPALVAAVRADLRCARLVYGGGIDGPKRAAAMAAAADVVVVGNLVHSPDWRRFPETVAAVREVRPPAPRLDREPRPALP